MKNKKKITTKDIGDAERVEGYLRMLDRILLYNIAANGLPPQAIESIVELWKKVVMKSIDFDVSMRNEYLENTKLGRLAKLNDEPDGEDLRLHCLEQFNIAKTVITNNLLRGPEEPQEDDEDEGTEFSS